MNRLWLYFAIIVLVIGALLTACATSAAQPGTSAQPAVQTPAGKSSKVNLDEIFPAGPGRALVLDNCTTCHTITPIVVVQMTREARERWARDHRDRVPVVSDADYKTLTEYLVENFNPSKPIPQLPKELLDTWTSY